MTTYTVVDLEMGPDDAEAVSGLTLERAVCALMARSGYWWQTHRVDGVMTLFVAPHKENELSYRGPTNVMSRVEDDDLARNDIYRQLVGGNASLSTKSLTIVADETYRRENAKSEGED